TSLTAQLLHDSGVDAALPGAGLSGNLWPDASLLAALERPARVVVELTSSHLAFCAHAPEIAVITSFWPDHVELHGSLDAYRRAKETIVRGQSASDWLVVPDDGSCESFVDATPASVARFSLERPVDRGAFVRRGRIVVRWDDQERDAAGVDELPL